MADVTCECEEMVWWCNACLERLRLQAGPGRTITFNRIRPRLPEFIDPASLVTLDSHAEWLRLNAE